MANGVCTLLSDVSGQTLIYCCTKTCYICTLNQILNQESFFFFYFPFYKCLSFLCYIMEVVKSSFFCFKMMVKL